MPHRLLWKNWERLNGAQDNPGDSVDYLTPQIVAPPDTGWTVGSLSDYLSFPIGIPGYTANSFHHRAYNRIWNEWFRSENLQNSVVVDQDDGPDDPADYVLLKRGKRFDYFTSALPWPQKGQAVSIGLAGSAPVIGNGNTLGLFDGTNVGGLGIAGSGDAAGYLGLNNTPAGTVISGGAMANRTVGVAQTAADSGLIADLTGVSAVSVNDFRNAFQLQVMLERDARGGTRYTEILQNHFKCVSPDSRLQRSEYLGGSGSSVHFHPVAQTSSSDNVTPQGNLSAYATCTGSAGFTRSFVEHGVILGLVNVRADLSYQQGLDRMFSRRTRLDYYWPAFAHLGEQAILNKEIYLQGTSADDDVWGYQERHGEYRYKNSYVTGKFRSQAPGNLDIWHLAQNFGNLPALNADFIQDSPPVPVLLPFKMSPSFILIVIFLLSALVLCLFTVFLCNLGDFNHGY